MQQVIRLGNRRKVPDMRPVPGKGHLPYRPYASGKVDPALSGGFDCSSMRVFFRNCA